jgi:cytochrome c biogenesis protein CcmG/thiol:disulfide interchange protein DsbE
MSRQWGGVGIIVGLIVVLIGAGWLVRDRFAPIGVGSEAPNFTAVDLDGNPVRFADLEGEVVLLNIWATWCPPCREEMPSMQRLHERLGPEGLKIVAVSIDAPLGVFDRVGQVGGDVKAFADELGLTFAIWHDPTGAVQRTYRGTAVPESFLIDRNGLIQKKHPGALEWDSDAMVDLVTRLLES